MFYAMSECLFCPPHRKPAHILTIHGTHDGALFGAVHHGGASVISTKAHSATLLTFHTSYAVALGICSIFTSISGEVSFPQIYPFFVLLSLTHYAHTIARACRYMPHHAHQGSERRKSCALLIFLAQALRDFGGYVP